MKGIVLTVCLFLFLCPSVYGLTVTGDVVIDYDMGDEPLSAMISEPDFITTVTVVDGADISNFYIGESVDVNFYGGYTENLRGGEYGITTIYGGQIDNIQTTTGYARMYDGVVGTFSNLWGVGVSGGSIDTLRTAGISSLSGGNIGALEFAFGYIYDQPDIFTISGYGLSFNYDSDTTGTITGWLADGTWLGDGLPFLIEDRYGLDDCPLTINVHNLGDAPPIPSPEPSTILLFGSGIVGFLGATRRKKFKK